MDQQKRLLLTIVLSTAVMILWMQFFGPKPAQQPAEPGAESAQALDAGAKAPEAAAPVAPVAPVAQPAAAPVLEQPTAIPEQRIAWSTPAQELELTSQGGGLSKAIVKSAEAWPGYKFEERKADKDAAAKPVDLVQLRAGQPVPGASEISGDAALPLTTSYQAEKTATGVIFRGGNAQLGVEKSFEINPKGYDLQARYSVTNRAAEPKRLTLSVVYPAWTDPKTQKSGGFFSPPPEQSQAISRAGSDVERLAVEGKQKEESLAGPVKFVGFDQRYFLGAIFPKSGEGTRSKITTTPEGDIVARLEIDLGLVQPGQTVSRDLGFYLGPKELNELKRVSAATAAGAGLTPLGQAPAAGNPAVAALNPELDNAIDFGWWAVICRGLLALMKVFQKLVVNWGLAIVLLTVVVKVALYPLSHKQMASMEQMRRLQPQINELKKKYENDREKLNVEQMKLFQENKVNPFGGCLPLLVQMPIWFALYKTLQTSFELYREPLIAPWIGDLTLADPLYILPLAMGVTMFLQQKMQPQMGDPTQAKMMLYFMPILFTFMMLNLPAGLTLYIFTSNLLSIAQQQYLKKKLSTQTGSTGTALASTAGK